MNMIWDALSTQEWLKGLLADLPAALFIFLVLWVLGVVLKRLLLRIANGSEAQRQDILVLLGQAVKTTFVIIGLISALGTLGINVTAIVAGLGLTGFALSFALKDILSNAMAGILILFYQPYSRGQSITVANYHGTITSIDLRYTTLDSEQGKILIPNAKLFTENVIVHPS